MEQATLAHRVLLWSQCSHFCFAKTSKTRQFYYLLKYCRKLALATEFYFGRNTPIFASQKPVKLAVLFT